MCVSIFDYVSLPGPLAEHVRRISPQTSCHSLVWNKTLRFNKMWILAFQQLILSKKTLGLVPRRKYTCVFLWEVGLKGLGGVWRKIHKSVSGFAKL